MDTATTQALAQLNRRFYDTASTSFSQSRQAAWPGWERVARHLPDAGGKVLDVACGNLRFERFLRERFPGARFDFHCLDACPELVGPADDVRFRECDVIAELMEMSDAQSTRGAQGTRGAEVTRGAQGQSASSGADLPGADEYPCYDIAVSFGFMHHVPSGGLRELLLRFLVDAVRPQGLIALSFWRFMTDERLARKAELATRGARQRMGLALDEDDYLLGWNDVPGLYRYCHHFPDREVDELVESVADRARLVDRFTADGRTGSLNTYVVLSRR